MELRATWLLLALPVICCSLWAYSMADNYGQCVGVFDREMEKVWQTGRLPAAGKIMDSEPCRRMDAQTKVTRAVLTPPSSN